MTIEHVAAMTPVSRSPDPTFQILHPSFAKFRLASGTVERIASDCRWTEGPVWFGDARCLLWSEPIGHIALPERCGNLCFGGRWRNRLFMTSCSSVYAVYVNTQGVLGG